MSYSLTKTDIKMKLVQTLSEVILSHIKRSACGSYAIDFDGNSYKKQTVELVYKKNECVLKVYISSNIRYHIQLNTKQHNGYQTEFINYYRYNRYTNFENLYQQAKFDFDNLISNMERLSFNNSDEELEYEILREMLYKEDNINEAHHS